MYVKCPCNKYRHHHRAYNTLYVTDTDILNARRIFFKTIQAVRIHVKANSGVLCVSSSRLTLAE